MKKIFIFFALLTSFIIYLFYRSEGIILNVLFKICFSESFYHQLRNQFADIDLPGIVIYSLPGGLWVFCATAISANFFIGFNKLKINLSYLPLIFCCALELFQLFKITDGTFDINDLGTTVLFWNLAFTLFHNTELYKIISNKKPDLRAISIIGIYSIVYLSDVY